MAGNQEDFLSDRDLEPLARQWVDLLKAAISEGFQGPEYEQPATPQYSPEPAPSEEIVQTGMPVDPGAIRSLLKLFLGMGRNAPRSVRPLPVTSADIEAIRRAEIMRQSAYPTPAKVDWRTPPIGLAETRAYSNYTPFGGWQSISRLREHATTSGQYAPRSTFYGGSERLNRAQRLQQHKDTLTGRSSRPKLLTARQREEIRRQR